MKKRLLIPGRRNSGFTAIEIAMVATVISIIALIILPLFRNRVEETKITAAQADLRSLMGAQQLVKADVDAYARLEDLDNVELLSANAIPPNGVVYEVPFFLYRAPVQGGNREDTRDILVQAERVALAGTEAMPRWKGPYIAFQRKLRYGDRNSLGGVKVAGLFASNNGGAGSAGGFAYAIQDVPGGQLRDSDDNYIPVDPWGNPYLFFPPTGKSMDAPGVGGVEFPNSVMYCLGPNGVPGDGSGGAAAYTREYTVTGTTPGRLGDDDDLMVQF